MKTNIVLYDIPAEILENVEFITIDTEALGLNVHKDRLCTVQICINHKEVYIVHFPEPIYTKSKYLKILLKMKRVIKIFHFARFDMGIIGKYLGIIPNNIICTRILSKITRSYTNRHGLKALVRDYIHKDISKEEQTSYWGSEKLTKSQTEYAANDVIYLYPIYNTLKNQCERENRWNIFKKVCESLKTIVELDLYYYNYTELYDH